MKNLLIAALAILAVACAGGKGAETTVDEPVTAPLLVQLRAAVDSGRYYYGHHDDTAYGHTWQYCADSSDVKNVTGQYPGLMSWDLGMLEYDSLRNLDGVPFTLIRHEAARQHKRGGINAISWHPRNPLTGGNSWDTSAQPLKELTTNAALRDTMVMWLDRVAGFVGSLKDEEGNPLPVIFRPWHENSGSWFWWGAPYGSPEEYIALWKLTRERFDAAGVSNVLWAYSPDKDLTHEQYFATYPGDEYVDILGTDIYAFGTSDEDMQQYTDRLKAQLPYVCEEAAKRGKVAALTETGLEGLEVHDWYTRVLAPAIEGLPIAYVCVWRNGIYTEKPMHFYAPYPGHPAEGDFKKYHDSKRPIFVD